MSEAQDNFRDRVLTSIELTSAAIGQVITLSHNDDFISRVQALVCPQTDNVDIRLLGSGLGPHTQRVVSKKLSQIAARVHNVNSAAEEPQAIESAASYSEPEITIENADDPTTSDPCEVPHILRLSDDDLDINDWEWSCQPPVNRPESQLCAAKGLPKTPHHTVGDPTTEPSQNRPIMSGNTTVLSTFNLTTESRLGLRSDNFQEDGLHESDFTWSDEESTVRKIDGDSRQSVNISPQVTEVNNGDDLPNSVNLPEQQTDQVDREPADIVANHSVGTHIIPCTANEDSFNISWNEF